MKLSIPSVSFDDTIENIATAIENAKDGLLSVGGLPQAPKETLEDMFDKLSTNQGIGDRLNKAYTNNLVYKDSFAKGKGGPTVDRKRVLDLSPQRLVAIEKADPELLKLDPSLSKALSFWGAIRNMSMNTTLALAKAVGTQDLLQDVAFNYRMVDYYEHKDTEVPAPRCGEHRDFGWYTIIFAQEPGLQVQGSDGSWLDVPELNGGALLLFGWCTQIRSNGRIPAARHRVVDTTNGTTTDVVPRRTSAVFFVAPKNCDTSLDPVIRSPGIETQKYKTNVKAGQLRGSMARKWQKREGTLTEKSLILEEDEIRLTGMKTQDEVVHNTITI